MKKFIVLITVLIIALFLSACSESTSSEEPSDEKEKEEETEAAEEPEEEAVPEDDELFEVLEVNIQSMMDQDIDAHMETIHSESPAYNSTKDLLDQVSAYTLDMKLSDLAVEEKSEEEARVAYTQTSMKVDGPEYQNNLTKGVHTLKPEDGVWKIFGSEVIETTPLDENGEEIEEGAVEDVAMEGQYADLITSLEMPFNSDKWVLGNYNEAQGEGIAEFLINGETFENYTELLTVHVFPDAAANGGITTFVEAMETNLTSMIDGELEFNRLEETDQEVIYEFSVTDDSTQYDQEEVARAFSKDDHLYVVRYTTMEKMIENKEDWLDKLKDVK